MNVPTEAQEQTALFQWAAMMQEAKQMIRRPPGSYQRYSKRKAEELRQILKNDGAI